MDLILKMTKLNLNTTNDNNKQYIFIFNHRECKINNNNFYVMNTAIFSLIDSI